MPEHFTKTTFEAKYWCSKCAKPTMHSVFDGRRGACLDCIARLDKEKTDREALAAQQPQQTGFMF